MLINNALVCKYIFNEKKEIYALKQCFISYQLIFIGINKRHMLKVLPDLRLDI
jgi:hypothetical protein